MLTPLCRERESRCTELVWHAHKDAGRIPFVEQSCDGDEVVRFEAKMSRIGQSITDCPIGDIGSEAEIQGKYLDEHPTLSVEPESF